jgi:hypothetical protein
MDLYAIPRRSGFAPEEIEEADARSKVEAAKRADRLRHVRSYVLEERDGRLGTVCFYEAESPEAIVEHARAAGLPCDEVILVAGIAVSRPDPELAGPG